MNKPSEDLSIRTLDKLPEQALTLQSQAVAEGFRFLTRLISEWENGTLRLSLIHI